MKKIGFACYETIEYFNPNPSSRTVFMNNVDYTLKTGTISEIQTVILRIAIKYPSSLPLLEEIIRDHYPQYLKVYNQIVLIS